MVSNRGPHTTCEDAEAREDATGKLAYESAKGEPACKGAEGEMMCERVAFLISGVTGSGKSTFIYNATGDSEAKIGHNLQSETREISEFVIPGLVGGKQVTLVDMPGFDDTYTGSGEILIQTADWLKTSYDEHKLLSGIIFLHDITETRFKDSARRTIEMIKELSGSSFSPNILLVTNMWDTLANQKYLNRERELKEKFWKPLIEGGAKTDRYEYGDTGSLKMKGEALRIISSIVGNMPRATKIQEEMVLENRGIQETDAGKLMVKTFESIEREADKKIEDLQEAMRLANEETSQFRKKAYEMQMSQELKNRDEIQKERERFEKRLEEITEKHKREAEKQKEEFDEKLEKAKKDEYDKGIGIELIKLATAVILNRG